MATRMDRSSANLALRALREFWFEAGLDPMEVRANLALRAPPPPLAKRAKAQPPSPLDAARALARGAADLGALRLALEGFHGCALRAAARSTVFLDGPEAAPILLIGERPDKSDDALGRPMTGDAGKLLDAMLAAIGLNRAQHVLITNLVYWRPPGDRAPTATEIALCMPFLERAIALLQPKLLILCGEVPAQAVLRSAESLPRLRRRMQRFSIAECGLENDGAIDALVTLSPVYLLARPQDKRLAWRDLQLLEPRLEPLGIARSGPG